MGGAQLAGTMELDHDAKPRPRPRIASANGQIGGV